MTAQENMEVCRIALGIQDQQIIPDLLEFVGLHELGRKKTKDSSLGMKQRLMIAIALLDRPELLILDEPMNGLDPTGIIEVRELLLKLNRERHLTIIISSHILEELSKIATHYGVIHKGKMADEFTPITTQEELDRVIGERLKRERETVRKEYKDYLSPEQEMEKYKGYLSPEAEKKKYERYLSPEEAAKKDALIKKYETDSVKTRIARETGIPPELAERLSGEDEAAIKKDAESLAKLLNVGEKGRKVPPLKNTEPDGVSAEDAAYRAMLSDLKGEE